MNNQELYARVRASLVQECVLFGSASPGARLLRAPGVLASIVPATPDRSMFNWVVYEHREALLEQYQGFASAYEEAGVRAWTVWVDPDDNIMPPALTLHGHKLDSQPVAMAAAMDELILPPPDDLDWRPIYDLRLVAQINDQAYGFPPPAFEAALQQWPDQAWYAYLAYLQGEAVGTVMIYQGENGDCGVTGVATLPQARGHGIATRLLAVALRESQARGATTTTLQASPLGASVYAALGYRNLGVMGMWERRRMLSSA